MFKLFMCAVCQVEVKPGEGVSIHAGSSNCRKLRPWDGPFLCASCQEKKDAMEGKRSSGGTYLHSPCGLRNLCVDLLGKLIVTIWDCHNVIFQIDIVVRATSQQFYNLQFIGKAN